MNTSSQHHNQDWEKQLQFALGNAPAPDFNAWCEKYSDTISALSSVDSGEKSYSNHKLLNRKYAMTALKVAAALLLVAGGFLWLGEKNGTKSHGAFANAIAGVDNVKAMKWTTTFYLRCTSKDGKKSCIKKERRLHAYRHPGQYRETFLDESGKPYSIHIADYRAGRMLTLNLKDKKAVLKIPPIARDTRGPFAWVGDMIRKKVGVSLVGQREIDNLQANVVRKTSSDGKGQKKNIDCFFDSKTKQFVGLWSQDEAGLEFDAVLEENDIPREKWYMETGGGYLAHEIVLDAKFTDTDFSLDPPTDYEFEKLAKPTVTEDEMIAYLGAAARFNDNNFPPSPYRAFDSEKFNIASFKDEKDRTQVEQALIDIRDKIMMREIYQSPVRRFEEDQTEPNSFCYVGTGVKVGEADKIVGWYKLRNGKQLRAFYGDLSVKDVTEDELPLDLASELLAE